MAVPRPVILAVLGVAFLAAAFVFVRENSNNSTVAQAPSVAQVRPTTPSHTVTTPAKPHATTAPAHAAPAPAKHKPAAPATNPTLQPVVDALNSGNTVVVVFSQSGSPDDTASVSAAQALHGQPGVSTFYANLNDLTAYRPLLAGVGISQVPAIVVMRTGQSARLIEGFVDPATLAQTVADIKG